MRVNGKDLTLGLLIGKVLKVTGIKLGFIWPTFRARLILYFYGCAVGKNLQVCGKVHFRPGVKNAIALGNNVKLTARFLTNTAGITNPIVLECINEGRIEIGDHSGLTSTIISARTRICIGKHVKIGANVRLFDHDFHALGVEDRRNSKRDAANARSAEMVIEDDVFIGANSIILKGVRIGRGSIVGAGSVVSLREIPPFSKVMGNPARIYPSASKVGHAG